MCVRVCVVCCVCVHCLNYIIIYSSCITIGVIGCSFAKAGSAIVATITTAGTTTEDALTGLFLQQLQRFGQQRCLRQEVKRPKQ